MKKIIVIVVALLLVFTFVGCEGGESGVDNSTSTAEEVAPVPAPTPTQPSKETIEQEIQGAWKGSMSSNEVFFIFDNGSVSFLAKLSETDNDLDRSDGKYIIEDGRIKSTLDRLDTDVTLNYTFDNGELVLSADGVVFKRTDITELLENKSGPWRITYYLDEFKQPTSDGFVGYATHNGTFSNSATKDSALMVMFLVDKEKIAIVLQEYGRNVVVNSSTRNLTVYNITMRTDDDSRYEMTGVINLGGDRIIIDERYWDIVIGALSGTGTIDFYIVQEDRPTTTYLFTIEAANFADEYLTFLTG